MLERLFNLFFVIGVVPAAGLTLAAVLYARRIRGSILWGIIVGTALVIVGAMMFHNVVKIDWREHGNLFVSVFAPMK